MQGDVPIVHESSQIFLVRLTGKHLCETVFVNSKRRWSRKISRIHPVHSKQTSSALRPRFPSTAILILTAYDDDEYVFALLEAGAAGYLLKDAHGREVVEAVRSVYSGESVLHPAIARKVIQRAIIGSPKASEGKSDIELSQREKEVLRLAAKGMNNKDIADTLCISIRTVQGHLNSIFHKLSVGSRTEAIFQSVKRGWLSFEDLA